MKQLRNTVKFNMKFISNYSALTNFQKNKED